MSKTSITVQQDTLERFKQRKETASEVAGVPEPNGDEFVTMLLNCWDNYEVSAGSDGPDLDDIQRSVRAIEERLGGIETAVEELGR